MSSSFSTRGAAAFAVFSTMGLAGCGTVGSIDIANARGAYTEVIRRTDDEQLLRMIVHSRYGDSFGFLSVASVTSSLSLTSTLGAQFGVGPEDAYAGNLVPLSAGVTFAESPTISYVPRQGEAFVRELLAPIPLDMVILLLGAIDDSEWLLAFCIERINGLRNAAVDGAQGDFERACELVGELSASGTLAFARSSDAPEGFVLSLRDYSPADAERVHELLSLLKLDASTADGRPIDVPMHLALGGTKGKRIDLVTRSPYDLLRIAAEGVETPPEHASAGLVRPGTALPPGTGIVTVRSSRARPKQASVAIEHRGWWFYIDDTDAASKLGFLVLRSTVLSRLQQEATAGGPALTIPVGG